LCLCLCVCLSLCFFVSVFVSVSVSISVHVQDAHDVQAWTVFVQTHLETKCNTSSLPFQGQVQCQFNAMLIPHIINLFNVNQAAVQNQ
jgi:hypothetical protein